MKLSSGITTAAIILARLNVSAQPTFGNPSPTAGTATSEKANAAADVAAYKAVDYVNKARRAPELVVIPGEVKSNNATFSQKFGPNNIADFAELELSQANFGVLERSNPGPLIYLSCCGFNAFSLRDDQDPHESLSAFDDFSDNYQDTVDRLPLFRRRLVQVNVEEKAA
jgi:hypothetical protein